MRTDQPSRTAAFVAAGRAIASRTGAAAADPHDKQAERLLSAPLRALVHAVVGVSRIHAVPCRWLLRAVGGLIDHVALRAAMIDRAVNVAVGAGCQQLVVVGAGLDTRAHRVAALSEVRVFEVDHPATQASKRRRMDSFPDSRPVRYVAVDLATASLSEALAKADHDDAVPTLWIWEGVMAYLSRAQMDKTLSDITGRSAPGSQLVASYLPFGAHWPLRVRLTAGAMLPIVGERLGDALRSEEVADMLTSHGLRLEWDLAPCAWFEQVGRGRAPRLYDYERLMLASAPSP